MSEQTYRLSVVMIVKNEAHNLAISLPRLTDLADEIVILDSGSTDDSQKVAERFGAKWYVNTDWQGFGRQRQIAQTYATGDWILALDADEELTDTLKASILEVKKTKPCDVVYGLKRLDFIFGKQIDNRFWGLKSYWRLYPARFGFSDCLVHESLDIKHAKTVALKGFLHHHTAPTPQFLLQKRLGYATIWASEQAQKGKKVSFLAVLANPLWQFFRQYVLDGRFLQGRYGLIFAIIFANYTFNKYLLLWQECQ